MRCPQRVQQGARLGQAAAVFEFVVVKIRLRLAVRWYAFNLQVVGGRDDGE